MIRRTSDSWMPDIFNDFFDNSWMERPTYTAPAINVMENEKEYEVELAAPGLDKEDFKVHVDAENNLLLVKGSVPGAKKSLVTIREAVKAAK